MNITKTIKYVKYAMLVYDNINKDLSTIYQVCLKNTPLKEVKEGLANNSYELLEIINTEYFSKKYSMEISEFIKNATEIKEKGE